MNRIDKKDRKLCFLSFFSNCVLNKKLIILKKKIEQYVDFNFDIFYIIVSITFF